MKSLQVLSRCTCHVFAYASARTSFWVVNIYSMFTVPGRINCSYLIPKLQVPAWRADTET